MTEAQLLSFTLNLLRISGCCFWRVPNGGVMHSIGGKIIRKASPIKGMPDIAGVMPNGRFYAIELKTVSGKLSPEQKNWIERLNHTGAMAVVLRSTKEVEAFVTAIQKNRHVAMPTF